MTTGLALQVAITGLAVGATYGLIGVGFSLGFRLTGAVHLAYGEVLAVAVFVALVVAGDTATVAVTPSVGRDVVAVVAGALTGAGLGLATFALAGRQARPTTGALASLIAVALVIDGVLGALFRREAYATRDALPPHWPAALHLGGADIAPRAVVSLAVAAALALATAAWLHRSGTGRAMRAVIEHRVGAHAVGLPVERLSRAAFALAGALGAVAALAATLGRPVNPTTTVVFGLKGMAAALAGGMGGPGAVMLAGIALGVLEEAVGAVHGWGPAWRDLAPLLIVLALMAMHPPAAARESLE